LGHSNLNTGFTNFFIAACLRDLGDYFGTALKPGGLFPINLGPGREEIPQKDSQFWGPLSICGKPGLGGGFQFNGLLGRNPQGNPGVLGIPKKITGGHGVGIPKGIWNKSPGGFGGKLTRGNMGGTPD